MQSQIPTRIMFLCVHLKMLWPMTHVTNTHMDTRICTCAHLAATRLLYNFFLDHISRPRCGVNINKPRDMRDPSCIPN